VGSRIRVWEPGVVYSGSLRCNDRKFLLKPNHRLDNPLLHASCPASALDPRNDIVPVPSTIDIIGASVARAIEQHPVTLHWFESNVNHLHSGLSLTADQLDHVAPFLQQANSLIARGINKLYEHEGQVLSGPVRFTPCIDDVSAEDRLLYALTNPVKDGLIESTRRTPLFSTYRAQAGDEALRYWYIDWEAWWSAGGSRKRGKRPKDFLRWVALPIAPLPELAEWPAHRVQSRVRHGVRAREEHAREEIRAAGRTVAGARALFEVDPRDRPKEAKESREQPICHAADPQLRREFRRRLREILNEHRKASWDFRMGYFEREFPEGTYRPPIATIYNSSRR
jgi:hypothetical protein